MSFLLIYFQRRFLFWLFQTQVSFSVLNISYLLTSETPSTDIQSMITRGGILVGIVLVLEVLLLYGFSLYFFTAFWLWFRRKISFKRDLLLVLGYLVLIGGSECSGDDRND